MSEEIPNQPSPEPNGYELQRSILKIEKDVRDGFTDIKVLMAAVVTRDLFDYVTKEHERRLNGIEDRQEVLDARTFDRRWRLIGTVLVPIATVAASILIALYLR